MRTARATAALGVLVLPHLLIIVLLATLLLLALGSGADAGSPVLLGPAVLLLAVPLVVVAAVAARRRHRVPGTVLPEPEQPRLWSEVRLISRALGVSVPEEIRLVPDPDAWVLDDFGLLVPRRIGRRLFLGAPLLVALTGAQLRAVLVQQLARYGDQAGRRTGLVYGLHSAVEPLVAELRRKRRLGRLVAAWTQPFRLLARPLVRDQILAADRLSAQAVGRDNAVAALAELGPLTTAWTYFLTTYADLGVDLGLRPDDLFGGFRDFLADPDRRRQLEGLRARENQAAGADQQDPLGLPERASHLHSSIAEAGPPDRSGPALAVLARPEEMLRLAQDQLWPGLRQVSWEELAAVSGAATVTDNAGQYLAAVSRGGLERVTLSAVLADLRSGRSPGAAQLARVSPDRRRDLTVRLLGDLVAALAIAAGRAEFRPRWGGPIALTDLATGEPIDPWTLAEDAWGSVDGTRLLRERLVAWGLDLEAEIRLSDPARSPVGPPATTTAETPAPVAPGVLVALGPVSGHQTRFVLVQDQGLLLVGDSAAALSGAAGWPASAAPSLTELLSRPADQLVSDVGSEAVPWAVISTVRLIRDGGLAPVLAVILNNGDSRILTLAADGQILGDVDRVLSRYLQDRYVRG